VENLNYNHLFYFWIIAKEGGVTQACKHLRLTQPTLSAQLKIFEDSIGQPLFERKSRKLVLNDSGKLVFDYADTIFKKGQEMVDALRDSSVKNIVSVNVGAVFTLPKKNIHNFLKIPIVHGKVNINLVSGQLTDLLGQLNNLQLDMVLSPRPAPGEFKGFYSHRLERVPVIFVASPEFKSLRRKFPSTLNNKNLYLPSYQTETRAQIDHYFKKHNLSPRIKGEIEDIELLRVIAASGDGIVAIVRSAVSDLIKAKELYIIGDNLDIWTEFYMITPERKETHPVVADILKKYKD